MLSEISAQELTPRAYWPTPKGTKVAVAGYSYSFGDVLTDPSLPLAGLDSRIHVGANRWVFKTELGYMIPLAGRHALKAGFSMGVATESGGDFKSFLLSYQLLWY